MGDINGDGSEDLVVGAPGEYNEYEEIVNGTSVTNRWLDRCHLCGVHGWQHWLGQVYCAYFWTCQWWAHAVSI